MTEKTGAGGSAPAPVPVAWIDKGELEALIKTGRVQSVRAGPYWAEDVPLYAEPLALVAAPVPAGDAAALRQRFAEYQRDERENTVAEVVYWRQQYKQLAVDAIAALSNQVPAGDAVALAAECKRRLHATVDAALSDDASMHELGPLAEAAIDRLAALSREGQADSTGGTTT